MTWNAKELIKQQLRSCGHPEGWIITLEEVKGEKLISHTYCLGCLFEKVGLEEVEL